jgi:flavin reductase (DIM6/NTAB) family NADH-FMN oxidoreductase RutF
MNFNKVFADSFISPVGLVTSNGPIGHNIMACEWTHQISYSPDLIAVSIGQTGATQENIRATKEFGVSLTAEDQTVVASIAGNYKGREYKKIEALKEMGFTFTQAEKINVLLVENASATFECHLKQELNLGDHVMMVGEVIHAQKNEGITTVAFSQGKYWKLTENPSKPSDEERSRFKQIVEKHKRS